MTPVKANRAGVGVKIVLMPDLTRFVISIRSCGSQPRPHGELELLRGIGVRNHLLPERERELHGGLASGRSCQVPVALPAERQDHCHHRVHGHRPVPGEPKDCVQSVSDGFRVGRYWKQCSQIGKFLKILCFKFSCKSSRKFCNFLGYFEEHQFLNKSCCSCFFGKCLKKLGFSLFLHLVILIESLIMEVDYTSTKKRDHYKEDFGLELWDL